MARDRERDARGAQGGRGEGESANLDTAMGTTGSQSTGRSAPGASTSGLSGSESGWGAGAQGQRQGQSQAQDFGTQRTSFYSRASERASRRFGQGSGRFGAQGGHSQGGHSQGGHSQGGHSQGGHSQGGHSQGGYPQGGYQRGDYQSGGYQSGGQQGGGNQGGYQGSRPSGYQDSQQAGFQGGSQGPEGREWREQGSGRPAGQTGGDISRSGRGERFRSDERAGEWQRGAGQGESYGAQGGAGRSEFGSAGSQGGGERDWPGDQYGRQFEGGYQGAGGATAAGAAGFATGYGVGQSTRGYAGVERDSSADLGLGYRDFGEGRETGRRSRWQREPTAARDIMTKNPRSVTRNASVRDIAQIMRDESTGIVPVVEENGKLLGVVTDRDIVMRSLAEGKNPLDLAANDVMTEDVEAVTPDESLREVVDLMGNKQIRRVPVVDQNDRLVGIISMADVATRADYDEDLQDALEEISARRSFWSRIFG